MITKIQNALILTVLTAVLLTAVEPIVKEPSEHAGEIGKYQMKTEFPGNNYWVQVPSTYSENNPAGIHVYFHGQGGHKGASHFGKWNQKFLERFNLIGINMQYMDGDNMKEPATKVLAARHAIAQTMVDYKVLTGRGVICCFSGGGIPSGLFYSESSAKRGIDWPFNHMALYSSNSRMAIQQKHPMSWAVSVGANEWSLAALGQTQGARFSEVMAQAQAHPDIYFNIIKGGGHTIHNVAVDKSAEIFERQDIVTSPMLYPDDYEEKELQRLVLASNALAFGVAVKEIKKILKKKNLDPALKAKVEDIQNKIKQRVDKMIALVSGLVSRDPGLAYHYGNHVARSIKGYDKQTESAFKDVLKGIDKGALKKSLVVQDFFSKQYPGFFTSKSKPVLSDKIAPQLKKFVEQLGSDDHMTQLCKEFLVYE